MELLFISLKPLCRLYDADLNDADLNTPEGNLLANSVAQEMKHMPKFSKEDL